MDAFIDLYGPDYVRLAVDLGVAPGRIDTIAARGAALPDGVRTDGSMKGTTPQELTRIAGLVADGTVEFPVAATFPLDQVQDAYALLEQGHTHGKIVLLP